MTGKCDKDLFGIEYNNESRCFTLQMEHSTYIMGLAGADIPAQTGSEGMAGRREYLGHVYYGKKLRFGAPRSLLREKEYSYMDGKPGDKCTFMDGFPFEYSFGGTGDFRPNSLEVRNADGFLGCELTYRGYRIFDGKKKLEGLPATFSKPGDASSASGSASVADGEGVPDVKTLEIDLEDTALGLVVTLSYSIFRGLDVVARSVRVSNEGEQAVILEKCLSACIELPWENREIVTLSGSWARERSIDRRPIGHGRVEVGSKRGISSHQEHPFLAICSEDAGEKCGEVLGMSFVYSGSFTAEVERTQHDALRAGMGISDYNFSWKLAPGAVFQAPEVLLVYSSEGFGGMSRTFHDLFRKHLIRSPYLHKKRPILINNWEATYFDFNKEKLLEIARVAKSAGIEMLVMDDGWFGRRSSDNSSLGDWVVNEEKLPGGMKALADEINALGMELGVWFEPEMICPDSDLYRAHPDWALAIPGRRPSECRSQFVLDLTRPEVRDYVVEIVSGILESANIAYVKWDMNRPLTDLGSTETSGGEILHRYMLGVYELQERILERFPSLLLENCTSGGGRFDPGMLYYSPQIWCSDDTDAIERLSIQEGTTLIYPPSTVGAHVSICPNHIVGRTTSFDTRGIVAMAGTFGYELDITKLSEEEMAGVRRQVEQYHAYNDLIREGEFYRICSMSPLSKNKTDRPSYAWMSVAGDKSEALLSYVQVRGGANLRSEVIHLAGLDPDAVYQLPDGRQFGGDELMYAGFVTDKIWGDGASSLYHFVRV